MANTLSREPSACIGFSTHEISQPNHIPFHDSPTSLSPNLTPCSDMSGQIIALGSPPESLPPSFNLHVGDRICANFAIPGFVFGDLGAHVDGVLKEYVVFEAGVSRSSSPLMIETGILVIDIQLIGSCVARSLDTDPGVDVV